MSDVVSRPVPPELAGERADKIVAQIAGISRQRARALFESAAGVTVEGRRVAASERLRGGLLAFAPPEESAGLKAETVPFTVVYEDDDLLVVDKPAGVVVHPGAGRSTGTLVSGLLARFPELEGVGEAHRWGLVHRLDKETSGLLLVARRPEMHGRLAADLAARRIHRGYQALVHGEMEMPTGTIDAPIGRDPFHPTKKRVSPDGRPARTHYRVLRPFGAATLVEVTLETGRTHQIRVHLAAIGHPVVGDRTYARQPAPVTIGRMFLHAATLELAHPRSGEALLVRSPLPAELASVIAKLGSLEP